MWRVESLRPILVVCKQGGIARIAHRLHPVAEIGTESYFGFAVVCVLTMNASEVDDGVDPLG